MTLESRPRTTRTTPVKGSFSIPLPIIVIIAVAVVGAIAIILLSNSTQTDNGISVADFAAMPQQRLADGGFVVGNKAAPITIIEFEDYACPHCQEYKPTIDKFINDYVKTGKAMYELRIFPTAGGQTTEFFGKVAVCMEDQKPGAYWSASELFIRKAMQGDYGQNTGREIADEIGVDYNTALGCSSTQKQLDNDAALAAQIGVTGTPGVAMRLGNGAPTFITYQGQTYNSGGVPANVLDAVVQSANA